MTPIAIFLPVMRLPIAARSMPPEAQVSKVMTSHSIRFSASSAGS